MAKLEGLSGEWEAMDYRGIVDYMSGDRTVVRDAADWHLHNPNAEQVAQRMATGMSAHIIDELITPQRSEDGPNSLIAAPDFDL